MRHFLHISKTGGTAMMAALRPFASNHDIMLHPHTVRLQDVPVGEKVFFALRDPVSRFVSGFYSRLRKEQPRHYVEWTDAERIAFREFSTPNELAEALSSPADRVRASYAMQNIGHVQTHLRHWFGNAKALQARRRDILLIVFQESLDADFAKLAALLGLPPTLSLPHDDVGAHRNPSDLDRNLSDRARANLEEWYREDFAIYDRSRKLR